MARTMPKTRVGQQTTGLGQGYADAAVQGGGIVPGAHKTMDEMIGIKIPTAPQLAKKVVHGIGKAAHFIMNYAPFGK